jgi:carbamate kinase
LDDRIVIAVGGNALQRRGERLTIENMLKAAADMAPTIAGLASEHELVLTHGNGPQVGELALERSAATFDVLGAESMGQIGYVLAQALASVGTKAAPILTQVVSIHLRKHSRIQASLWDQFMVPRKQMHLHNRLVGQSRLMENTFVELFRLRRL